MPRSKWRYLKDVTGTTKQGELIRLKMFVEYHTTRTKTVPGNFRLLTTKGDEAFVLYPKQGRWRIGDGAQEVQFKIDPIKLDYRIAD